MILVLEDMYESPLFTDTKKKVPLAFDLKSSDVLSDNTGKYFFSRIGPSWKNKTHQHQWMLLSSPPKVAHKARSSALCSLA